MFISATQIDVKNLHIDDREIADLINYHQITKQYLYAPGFYDNCIIWRDKNTKDMRFCLMFGNGNGPVSTILHVSLDELKHLAQKKSYSFVQTTQSECKENTCEYEK